MEPRSNNSTRPDYWGFSAGLSSATVIASALLVATAVLVLFGWCWDIPALKSVLPRWVTMKVNTALGFLLSGVALWCLRHERLAGTVGYRVGQLCAGLVALLGLFTILEYACGWNLAMDNTLFPESTGATQTSSPGRMAPATAGSFLFAGLALLLLDRRTRRGTHPAQLLALPPLALSLLALLGYLYGAKPLYWLGHSTAMAMHTALAFAVLGLGVLWARPDRGWVALLAADTPGSAAARRLVPATLLVVPLLFWLRMAGERAGLYGPAFGVALMVLASMVALSAGVCWSAGTLNRAEADRWEQERRLTTLMSNVPGMAYSCRNDSSWTMTFVSGGVRNLTGYEPEDLVGNRTVAYGDLVHPDDRQQVWDEVQAAVDRRQPFRVAYRLLTATGGKRWVQEQGRGVFDENGNLLALEGFVTDVTDRNRAEASLQASEARFAATFQQAAVGIALVAPDGRWLQVNHRLCEIVGYSEEELLARSFQDITHPDDLDKDLGYVRRMLAREIDTYSLEKRYRRKNGSPVWINLTVSLTWTAAEKPDYFIAVVQDIDARKRAEAALRESEANLKEAKRLAGLGNWAWDLRTDVHTWSEEIYRFYGRDPALPPAVYPEVKQYFTPESWERLSAAVERGMAAGLAYECDAEVVGGDGNRRWITARGEPVRNREGTVVQLHGTVQDITERKRTEERLRALNRQLKGLQEAYTQLATAKTLDEIMAIARATARKLTAADGATFVLRDGDKCFYADEDAIAPLWKGKRFPMSICISGWVMLNHRHVVIEDIYADNRIPADAYRPTFVKSLAMVPIRAAEPLGAIGNYWATEHRATEDEMALLGSLADGVAIAMENIRSYELLEQRVAERTDELRAANEELDAFAYAVSHDLRAPLRAMSGFANALLEDLGDSLPEEGKHFLDEIILGSRRMGELIDGLLRLSRGTRGELQRDRLDLTTLASRILTNLAAESPDRNVAWTVEPDLVARGDGRMLEVVLENLLGNAWKYTSATPNAAIRVHAEHTPDEHVFCVTDNGAGFDMRYADKLFQPFQRLHRQDEFPGIGIGLATVQRILHRHGGTIDAASVPGEETTFRCHLPRGGNTGEETAA
jgi:PAS domain S-box-containing protein